MTGYFTVIPRSGIPISSTSSPQLPSPGIPPVVGPGQLPRLSVVVPAFRCGHQLRACLLALHDSDLPREQWELIVADDGSPDDTGDIARQYADRVVRTGERPRGPAHARNCGAHEARAEILLFVDADVLVQPHVLSTVLTHFAAREDLVGVFGTYDAAPSSPGLVSQYRNLLHRYVHLAGAGEATTFWAGIGAVRRAAFTAVGGFDAARFTRPQIEDIDLGYRLHDAGGRLQLDPAIAGTHLKRWSLGAMLLTDLRDRAMPWTRLLLDRRSLLRAGPLNTSRHEQRLVLATSAGMVSVLLAALTLDGGWLAAAAACAAFVIVGNARVFAWFAEVRGPVFALSTVPLRLLFYVVSVIGAGLAVAGVGSTVRRAPPLAPVTVREVAAQ